MSISTRSGAHASERNLFLSAIRRSNRRSNFCLELAFVSSWRVTFLHTKPPPAGFGGSMRRSHAIAKKHAFLYVFSRPAKYQNDVIFVNSEGLRSCLSKPSYRAPKWALMVRLMQQERRKSPQKSIFQKTGPFGDVTETAILAILASHFRDRVDTPKKNPTWGLA